MNDYPLAYNNVFYAELQDKVEQTTCTIIILLFFFSFFFFFSAALELVGTSYRRVVGIVSKTSGIVASLLGALIAFLARDWRYIQVCLAAPCLGAMMGYL